MFKIKIYEFNDLRWRHIKDEEIDSYTYTIALDMYVKKAPIDQFYKIEVYNNDDLSAILLTINPFVLDGKAEVLY